MKEAIEVALESLRPGLASDGFDLRLESFNPGGVIHVALVARPDACTECLVSDSVLVEILEYSIRERSVPFRSLVLSKQNV